MVLRASLIAALLSLPALRLGLYVDDHLQRTVATGEGRLAWMSKGPLWIFAFFDGDAARTQRLVDSGTLPWWADLRARIHFFRPLSSLTHVLDYRVLGVPALMHLQSILWYVLVVALVAVLYRRLLGAVTAGLAAVLFAFDHTHGVLVGWLANRNALVAAAFGLIALLLHDRWRRSAQTRDSVLAATSFALALCGGESALGVLGYIAAHALFLERGSRVRALVPYAPVLAAWAVVYRVGHFGVKHSGMYQDPSQSPVAYVTKTLEHAPLLVGTELGVPGVDLYPFLSLGPRIVLFGVSALVIALGVIAAAPLLRRDPVMRFFAVGSVLSVLPFCAAFPSARLLLIPSIGLLAVIARVVVDVIDRTLRGFPAKFTALLGGAGHLFLSPFVFVLLMHQMAIAERFLERNIDGLPRDPTMAEQRLVVVNAPDSAFIGYIMIKLDDWGMPSPASMLSLGVGTRPLEVERRDARTLVVRSSVALFQPGGTDLLTRAANDPPPVGWRTHVGDIAVEVTGSNASGWPNEAVFTFPEPLEHRRYRWVAWRDQTLAPFVVPHIGERVELPAATPQLF